MSKETFPLVINCDELEKICETASPDLLRYIKSQLRDYEPEGATRKLYTLELDPEWATEVVACLDPICLKVLEGWFGWMGKL